MVGICINVNYVCVILKCKELNDGRYMYKGM